MNWWKEKMTCKANSYVSYDFQKVSWILEEPASWEMMVKAYWDYPEVISERWKKQWQRLNKDREEGKVMFLPNSEPNKFIIDSQFPVNI